MINKAIWLAVSLTMSASVPAATVVVFGDSISAAYGLEVNNGWVAKLQQKLDQQAPHKHRVINASVSGETTQGGLLRLPRVLSQYKPDVLVLELGGNDGLRGQPPALMAKNLSTMVSLAQQQKVKVLLLGIKIPPNYGQGYSQAFEAVYSKVAQQYQVPLVPFIMEGIAGHDDLMQADGIHPNSQAQDKLLGNIWPKLHHLL